MLGIKDSIVKAAGNATKISTEMVFFSDSTMGPMSLVALKPVSGREVSVYVF